GVQEGRHAGLLGRILRACRKDADAPHSLGPLRTRAQRPCCDQCTQQRDELAPLHSITSSARSRNESGIVIPTALADLRFTTISNLVGCSTGMSAGLPPLNIFVTKAV